MSQTRQQQSKTARTNILAKLKKQVQGADYTKLPKEQGFDYPQQSTDQQLAQFKSLLEANHAQVIELEYADIAQVVADYLKKNSLSKLLIAEHSPLAQQFKPYEESVSLKSFDFELHQGQQFKETLFNEIQASITHSEAAIAATGSIVISPDFREPRTMSLVPPVHFIIVKRSTIYQNLQSLIEQQGWQNGLPTNKVLISGPSKTADIQQTLAYGAHGPKELIVLLSD